MSSASTCVPICATAPATDRSAAVGVVSLAGRRGSSAQDLGAALASGFDEEAMLAVEDLGEREVVARLGLRPGAHRGAEARAAGSKQLTATTKASSRRAGVVAVDVRAADEHAILDRDRVQLARAHADERDTAPLRRCLFDGDRAVRCAARAPEPDAGREEKLLPGMRPDCVAEARLVVASLEPVAAGLLDVRPPDRQIGRRVRARS